MSAVSIGIGTDPTPSVEVENERYVEITRLSQHGVVTHLTYSSLEEDNEETLKLPPWDEDLGIIKQGLSRGDHVFCTVVNIMGKKVLGNVKSFPKDLHILRMPDLVMDKIFSSLSLKDILNCRLTTPNWGLEYLPIHRIMTRCNKLSVSREWMNYTVLRATATAQCNIESRTVDFEINIPPRRKQIKQGEGQLHIKNPYIFNHLETLELFTTLLRKNDEEALRILENSSTIRSFTFVECGVSSPCNPLTSEVIKTLISRNQGSLTFLRVDCKLPDEVVNLESFVGNCVSLETLRLVLRNKSLVTGISSLPPSITRLSLLKLKVPLTNTQVIWISKNLKNLTKADLHVKHTHFRKDPDELDESTIFEVLRNLPALDKMSLALGPWSDDEVDLAEYDISDYLYDSDIVERGCQKWRLLVSLMDTEAEGWTFCLGIWHPGLSEILEIWNHGYFDDDFEDW